MRNRYLYIVSILLLLACSNSELYKNENLSARERAIDLNKRLTLEEKVLLLGGFDGASTNAIPRLGIPSINLINGPVGVGDKPGTAFPAGVAMAATWNEELIHQVGIAMGKEARAKKVGILLGPCLNIHRHPIGGRNFESYSEDPYLSGRMGINIVKGIQSERVAASLKHFALNNQELERGSYSAELDERTLREIYLPAFEMVVKEANPMTIMAAYNKVRGEHCTENKYLLTDILRNEWKFDGFVMSDWDAVHSTVRSIKAGLDFEMPGKPKFLNSEKILNAIKDDLLSEQEIDKKVINILTVYFKIGVFNNPETLPKGELNTPKHQKLAKKVAEEAIVLLRNENNMLPLNKNTIKSIAVIGPNAEHAIIGGGGSSEVKPFYSVSPLQGLKNKLGNDIKIEHISAVDLSLKDWDAIGSEYLLPPGEENNEHGLKGEYFNNEYMHGKPFVTRIDKNIDFNWGQGAPADEMIIDRYSARWTGKLTGPKTGKINIGLNTNDGSRLYIDDKLIINNWGMHGPKLVSTDFRVEKGRKYDIKIEYYEGGNNGSAKLCWQLTPTHRTYDKKVIELAKKSDIAIIFAGLTPEYEREAFDRESMNLPGAQNELIQAVASVNKNTIVVISGGSPVYMTKWINNVSGVIQAWYLGQETGNALADVILGNINPSGKLPVTFPRRYKDNPAYNYYNKVPDLAEFGEGIYVGYRHYDSNNTEPLFHFGFGLSYTRFEYRNLNIEEINNKNVKVSISVTNTGKIKGSEIVQLYVHDVRASVDRPYKELKGFAKVELSPSETKTVTITLDKRAFSFFDTSTNKWITEPGDFELLVGASSKDIKLKKTYQLK